MDATLSRSAGARPERYAQVIAQTRAAVERLLAESSFTALSVEQIIREAGIARSTFYVYFQDKGEMLEAFTEGVLDEALVAVRAWWQLPSDAGYPALRSALGGFITYFHQHSALLRAVMDSASYDARAAAGFGRMVAAGEAGIAEHIRVGQADGSVVPGIDAVAVARWLVRFVDQGLYDLVSKADSQALERHIDAASMIVWNTLYRAAR